MALSESLNDTTSSALEIFRQRFAARVLSLLLLFPLGCKTIESAYQQYVPRPSETSNVLQSGNKNLRCDSIEIENCESDSDQQVNFKVTVPFYVEAKVGQTVSCTICSVNAGSDGAGVLCAGSF